MNQFRRSFDYKRFLNDMNLIDYYEQKHEALKEFLPV